MKFHIKTYGCQMNERDSESLACLLERKGYTRADSEKGADIVVVNTCSVRGKAEEKALGKLGLLVSGKKKGERLAVGAIGCMVERIGADIFNKIPGLDFAGGTRRISDIPDIIREALNRGGQIIFTGESPEGIGGSDELSGHREDKVSAFVNILPGCERFCSYCIVPSVRGREIGRQAAHVIAETRRLAESGVKEITLLGQSVLDYGRRNRVWPDGDSVSGAPFTEPFARLLKEVAAVPGIERVRFTSSHPSGCTVELAGVMADTREVCEHIHLPLQSGSDRILRMMRRGYSTGDYWRAVERLKKRMPDLAVTTDIIVGFPSETEKDFLETLEMMGKIAFDNAFIFKYSPRPGTRAAEWEDDVPAVVKMERNRILLQDQDARTLRINRSYVGKQVEVLVAGKSTRNVSRWSGRTRLNKIAVFEPVPEVAPGNLVNVGIDRITAQCLYGKACLSSPGFKND